MVQIIGLLLCVYLVFKGYEILQVALCSPREDRDRTVALVVGGVFFVASIAVAVLFALWLIGAGADLSNQAPRLPK